MININVGQIWDFYEISSLSVGDIFTDKPQNRENYW